MKNMDKYLQALYNISPNVSYDEWMKTAMAAKDAGISFEEWNGWSQGGESYSLSAAESLWKSIQNGKGVTRKTLFFMAGNMSRPIEKTLSSPVKMNEKEVRDKFFGYLDAPNDHPYIIAKGGWPDGLKMVPHDSIESIRGVSLSGALVVPCIEDGRINTLQYITKTDKLNLAGASFGNGYFMQGVDSSKIYVTEGIGQSWSAVEATGFSAVSTFGVARTRKVVIALKKVYPDSEIILCADVGQNSNIEKIAMELQTKAVFMPDGWVKNSDINDLLKRDNIPALKSLLANPSTYAPQTQNIIGQLTKNDLLHIDFADEISDTYAPADEVVEGLIVNGDVSVMFGDSNCGKTYLAIDMACAVALGNEWMDRKTEKGMVVYLATESPSSVQRRIQAYQKFYNVKLQNFVLVKSPINLFNGDGDANKLIKTIKKLEEIRGQKTKLIIGDNLARMSVGANENSGQDMSVVVQNLDRIRLETSAHFLLIHHSGKNSAAGARGWSGIRAAVDTELEITASDKGRCCEVTKQRDLNSKGEKIGFDLESIILGTTKWGKPSTEAIVKPAEITISSNGRRISEVSLSILDYLKLNGQQVKKTDLVKHFEEKIPSASVYRELKKLVESGKVIEENNRVELNSPVSALI